MLIPANFMKSIRFFLKTHRHSYIIRYGFGVLTVALVSMICFSAQAVLKEHIPMSLFLGSVVIAAWFGGAGVGIFTTILGAYIEVIYFSVNPGLISLLVYMIQGLIISFIFGRVHEIQKRLSQMLTRERESLLEKETMLKTLSANQDELQAERQRAEQASKIKSLFLANMSHEIRTPLVSILGFAELLKDSEWDSKTVRKYGGIIERTGNNLLNIINDILDLSKVEAGQLEVEYIPFSVVKLMDEIASVLQVSCEHKGIKLEFNSVGSIPEFVISDPNRLRQILMNLVGNSIKFTETGFVRVTYEVCDNKLNFKVRDSGMGISDQQKGKLFEHFSQGDRSIARQYAGTGLGLSLSKQLAQKLGGDIFLLESEVGMGSLFMILIDFKLPSREEIELKEAGKPVLFKDYSFENKSVLFVDDSIDNQFLVQTILLDWGLKVVLASNGKDALEEVKKEKFDIILMDMQMPVMDGYTASKKLIENKCKTPIIALTASAMKEDRERCLMAGCRDYLTKPIQKYQLLHTIKKNIDETTQLH